jgi:hypothetical protein
MLRIMLGTFLIFQIANQVYQSLDADYLVSIIIDQTKNK